MKGPCKSFSEAWIQDLHVLSTPTYYSVTCQLPVYVTGKAVYEILVCINFAKGKKQNQVNGLQNHIGNRE